MKNNAVDADERDQSEEESQQDDKLYPAGTISREAQDLSGQEFHGFKAFSPNAWDFLALANFCCQYCSKLSYCRIP